MGDLFEIILEIVLEFGVLVYESLCKTNKENKKYDKDKKTNKQKKKEQPLYIENPKYEDIRGGNKNE